ncbi:hypothetical protein BOVMAS02_17150 [Streptococcus uberis]
MSNVVVRVDDKLKKEAVSVLNDLGLDMSSAVKIFLKQIIITQSIPFDIKLDNDIKLDTHVAGSKAYIRTRDLTEYNNETQKSYKEYMDQYKKEGIKPTDQSIDDYFNEVKRENADL